MVKLEGIFHFELNENKNIKFHGLPLKHYYVAGDI